MIVTHAGELEKLAGLQGEVVLQPSGPVRLMDFEAPALAGLSEPEGSGRIRLFDVSDESQWLKKAVAETDIGQPKLPETLLKMVGEEMIPAVRFGRPEEVAAIAAFLASERNGFLTGGTIEVSGGAGHLCSSTD